MKITDDIKYKIHFILDKQKNNEKLTSEEESYLEKYNQFINIVNSFQIERELETFNFQNSTIIEYLNNKEKEIRRTIPKTKSRRKLLSFQKMLLKIEKLRQGNLDLFKYYIADTYPYDRLDINRYIVNIVSSDTYTAMGGMDFLHNKECFIHQNQYTGEVEIKRANVLLAKQILGGNNTNYQILLELDKCDDKERRQELIASLPPELRNANAKEVNRIVYYGRGRIGNNKEQIFYNASDILDYLLMLSNMNSEYLSSEHHKDIERYAITQIEKYINGELPDNKITRYDVCRFIPKDLYSKKFLSLLSANNFNLSSVLQQLKHDDLISSTILNHPSQNNGFIDQNNQINLPNITLACEIIDGNYTNYRLLTEYQKEFSDDILNKIPENLRNADPRHMSRIVYYGYGRIGNPYNHDFDKDFYDLKILKILAEYQESLKRQKELEKTEEQKKSKKS